MMEKKAPYLGIHNGVKKGKDFTCLPVNPNKKAQRKLAQRQAQHGAFPVEGGTLPGSLNPRRH